jgi:hypothetical protein
MSKPRRPVTMTVDDGRLPELERSFVQQRSRARSAWRRYVAADEASDPTASRAAHQDWSDAVDDALTIIEAISMAPVHDLRGLLTQFEATWWWIREDDNVLDESTRRWLARFRRSLRRLVQQGRSTA